MPPNGRAVQLRNSLPDVFRNLAPNCNGVAAETLGRRLQLSVNMNRGFICISLYRGHTLSVPGGPADATPQTPPIDALTALGKMEQDIGAAPGVAPTMMETHNPV